MASIYAGAKLKEYFFPEKNREAFSDSGEKAGFITMLIFVIVFLIVWVWSMVLAFRCNKTPEDSIQQFVYVLIMTTLLPFISNVIYIYFKYRNMC